MQKQIGHTKEIGKNEKVINFLYALSVDEDLQKQVDDLRDKTKNIALVKLVSIASDEFGFTEQQWKNTIKELIIPTFAAMTPSSKMLSFKTISGVIPNEGRVGLEFLPPNLIEIAGEHLPS